MRVIILCVLLNYFNEVSAQEDIIYSFTIDGKVKSLYNMDGFISVGEINDDGKINFVRKLSETNIEPDKQDMFGSKKLIYDGNYQVLQNSFLIEGDTLLSNCKVTKLSREECREFLYDNIDPGKLKIHFPLTVFSAENKFYKFGFKNCKLYYDEKNGSMFFAKAIKKDNQRFATYEIIHASTVNPVSDIIDSDAYFVGGYYFMQSVAFQDQTHKSLLYFTNNVNKDLKFMELKIDENLAMISDIIKVGSKFVVFGNYSREKNFKRSFGLTDLKQFDGFFIAELDVVSMKLIPIKIFDFTDPSWVAKSIDQYSAILSYINLKKRIFIVSIVAAQYAHNFGSMPALPYLFYKFSYNENFSNLTEMAVIRANYTKKKYESELYDDPLKIKFNDAYFDHRWSRFSKPLFPAKISGHSIFNNLCICPNPIVLIDENGEDFIYETKLSYYKVSGWSQKNISCLDVKYSNANNETSNDSFIPGDIPKNTMRYKYYDYKSYKILYYGKHGVEAEKIVDF